MTSSRTKKDTAKTIARPPVVVVLGHVDHGKTTILDFIRKTRVAAREAGGITQHIGAYQVEVNNKIITFLDTPGHEAFSAIRSRGSSVADVAVLVVAADEGVQPQTKEAIQIIKQAKIPFIVAINKIDKDGANGQRVRQELAENDVMVEDYGGTIPAVEISAKNGDGMDHLLEMILLTAEMEELSDNQNVPASGTVLESHLDSRRGIVATLLVRNGSLRVGDYIYAGSVTAHVKSLEDFTGKATKEVSASQPCVCTGWESYPLVGTIFNAATSQAEASAKALEASTLGQNALFQFETSGADEATAKKTANLIIKADVQSSLQAIDQILKQIHSEEIQYRVINFGVGQINDSDVKKARATGAAVIGFHVGIDATSLALAHRENIRVEMRDIIYELAEVVRSIMSDLLDPEIRRVPLGKIKILALFGVEGKSQIVGGKIIQGKVVRGAQVEVVRNNNIVARGKLAQLQQGKKDVAEVGEGFEVGVRYEGVVETTLSLIRVGDLLDIYQEEKIKRSL